MLWGFVYAFLLLFLRNEVLCLNDVVLEMDPAIVDKGGTSKLRCSYDLQGAPLYTVKWYRGNHEFYRYTPKEHPSTKTFTLPGVNVDLQQSNEHQVVLQDVGFNLSGKFSCEVTTDAPLFSTKTVSKEMLVVVLPSDSPNIITDKSFYDIGDVLRANCSSPPSRPAATLTFILNNIVVCAKCNTIKTPVADLFSVDLSLDLPLFESHFHGGLLTLKCVSRIGDLYQQDSQITFSNARDPVPAKVTANNHSTANGTRNIRFLMLLIYLACVF
ncbi:unnamed protein product [Phaedon cochleariae]|uniref:Ig-like domain-containing protein n=1 Tax=Phaedon cochleariae TaxID=80249 RepID=A0A9P0DAP6_PHACE|nr:unnamed protein product [Phaedon cochleariae]